MTALRTLVLTAAILAAPPWGYAIADSDDPRERMVAAINEIRAHHGQRPLRLAPTLQRTATGYAGHLIRTDSFTHGTSYTRAGFRRSGEILALHHGGQLAVRLPLRLWMRSPGHRSLLLSSSFSHVGVGPARGRFGGAPTTIWVAHFGAR